MSEHIRVQYQDLDLKVYEDAFGDCWVEAIGTPGRRSKPVRLALDDTEIIDWVGLFKEGRATVEISEALGRALFTGLFSGEIASLWHHMRGTLDSQTALRVRLDIRHARLANLPWELMIPTQSEGFLAISPNRPITRCVYDIDQSARPELPQPLRLLIVVSSPNNAPRFDANRVVTAIRRTLAPYVRAKSIQITTVRHTTRARLAEELATDYDILHYIGHGTLRGDEGSLLLETAAGRCCPMNGREFGDLLVGANIRLAVISACELAGASGLDPRLGVADAALRAGIPAVVAMQSFITDIEAAVFSRAFYPALMKGEPLETCVAYGRRLIYAQVDSNHPGWAAPVLFSNLPDGILFDRMSNPLYGRQPNGDPVSGPGGASRSVVTQLPAQWYGELRHRGGELRRINDAMAGVESKRLIVISGPPGSGKSSLALEAGLRCLELSRREPGSPRAFAGVIWVSRRRPPLSGPFPMQRAMGWGVQELYRQLAEALPAPGLQQARPYEQSDLVRAALRRNRYLVIIDDFDELRGLTLEELADRLPAPTTVIVTSHAPLQEAALGVRLGKLSAGQAADLVRRAAVANGISGEITLDLRALGNAAGNPLALRLLAGRLADGEDIMAIAAARTKLPPQDQELLRLIIRESLDRCSEGEMAALRTVALYPEPLEPAEVAHALSKTEDEIVGFLRRLRRLGLVNVADDKTVFLLHRIRHEALRDVDEAQAETLIRRAVEHALNTIERRTSGSQSDQPPYTVAQIRNVLWAGSQAYALGDWKSVQKFRDGLHDVLFLLKLWSEGIELGQWAYDAADRLDEDEKQAWCALYPIARHHFYQADYQASRLWSERALDKFGTLGDAHGVAFAKRYLGRAMQAMGFPDEARRLFQEALSLISEGADDVMKGHLIAALAGLAEQRADYETAIRGYQDALEVYRAVDHGSGMAFTEHRLGCTALALGHHDVAREHLAQSLRLFVRHDRPDRCASVLQSLADLEESLGRLPEAGAYLLEAQKTVGSLPQADLTEIDARATRIAAKLPGRRRRESINDGQNALYMVSGGTRLGGGLGSTDGARLAGSVSLGSTDGATLVGNIWLHIAEIPIVRLHCPVEGCNRMRTAYDYWVEYWPRCPVHDERMVEIAPVTGS